MLTQKVGSCLNKEQQKRNIFWPYKNFQYKKGDWSRFLNVILPEILKPATRIRFPKFCLQFP